MAQQDSVKKIVLVALGVCLVCSLLVSSVAVGLAARQDENRRLDKIKNILRAADLYSDGVDVGKTYAEKVEPVLIELSSGETVGEDQFNEFLNIENFNMDEVTNHPEYGEAIPRDEDIGGISRKPKYMVVYLVKENDQLSKVILPVHGKGLWSTLYGFLSLNNDLKTVSGITFYQHAETPGLGGEVDNPRWQAIWKGKDAFDESGGLIIQVLKGQVDPSSPNAGHQIDGLAGATITTRGVDNFVKYWLTENGYGPFLNKLREGN